jgi:hypothetical protein
MRAAPYGPCWPNSCAICGWEVVCPCCVGRLLLVCVGVLSRGQGGDVWLCLRSCHEVEEREARSAIRAIRSDNGSEFRNSRFETFCHDLGLEHQFSSPYTPPQNGVVERKNRTLCEMARMMLDEHRTPRRFWAEAVNTTCYVSKRIYLVVHKKKTCYELMHGLRQHFLKVLPTFFLINIFGSVTNICSSTFFGSVSNILSEVYQHFFSSTFFGSVTNIFFVNIFPSIFLGVLPTFSRQYFSKVLPTFFLVSIFRKIPTFFGSVTNIFLSTFFRQYFWECCLHFLVNIFRKCCQHFFSSAFFGRFQHFLEVWQYLLVNSFQRCCQYFCQHYPEVCLKNVIDNFLINIIPEILKQ